MFKGRQSGFIRLVAGWVVVIVGLGCMAATPVHGEDDLAGLRAELSALRAEVARLRGEQGQDWMDERRAEQVKALVAEVIADADTRASMRDGSMTAGHDGRGFFLASEDNRYRLNIGGQFKLRYIANFRDDPQQNNESTTGFQYRRMRLSFTGHVADPRITYFIQPEIRRQDGRLGVVNLFIGYAVTERLTLHAGRMKAPFWREDVLSSTRQLAADRSLVNAVFAGVFTNGLQASYALGDTRLTGMVNDGFTTGLHEFTPGIDMRAARVGLTGRIDHKIAGDWSQHRDFTAWSGEPLGLFLGAAAHWEQNRSPRFRGAFSDTRDFVAWTVDASFYRENLALFAAFVGRHDTATFDDAAKFDDYGLLVQGGYTIDDRLQPFARYEWIRPDGDRNHHDLHLLTLGLNYYLRGHHAKFTSDVVWARDSLSGFVDEVAGMGGIGLLPDRSGQRDQVTWRTQFQLLF